MNKQEKSWIWYDWANSAFSMLDSVVIQIFLYDFILKNTAQESKALSIFGQLHIPGHRGGAGADTGQYRGL